MVKVRHCDIEIGIEDGKGGPTLYIYKSDTDQNRRGCFRPLIETGPDMRQARPCFMSCLSLIGVAQVQIDYSMAILRDAS